MSVRFAHLRAAVVLGILLSAASCDRNRNPTSPPLQPPTSAVVRLELEAPAEIPPGESAQLTANAVKADGSVENVSSRAVWTASPILQISASGLATAGSRGEAFISVQYQGRAASARIFVLPRGTFRLSGTIKEDTLGVPGVSVTVISGVGEGLTTTSDVGGNYALYGVSGTVRIQIKREAYLEGIHEVSATAHRTADFNIVPERPRADYRGNYRLTITAAPSCRSLPESARVRQ